MRWLEALVVCLVLSWGLSACKAQDVRERSEPGKLAVSNLRCEYRVDPVGIGERRPRLSWELGSPERGQRQTAYRILVASSPEVLSEDRGDLWDSGRVESDATSQIVYDGKPLESRRECHWKVRAWDRDGVPSEWSHGRWTMGLLGEPDWSARWIGYDAARDRSEHALDESIQKASWIWHPEAESGAIAPAATRYFRRTLEIPASASIARATCTFATDNSGLLFVNGKQVGSWGSFKEATQLDVSDRLRAGPNVVAVAVTNAGEAANPAGLAAAVRVEISGADPVTVLSDAAWKCSTDAPEGWSEPELDDADWIGVEVIGPLGCAPWGEVGIRRAGLFLPPVPYLRTTFDVQKPVRRAVVYASALGLYELHVNGQRIGHDLFTPGWSDYDTRVYCNTYDITSLLEEGDNALGSLLADGWYSGYVGFGLQRDHYGTEPRLRVQLEVEYDDGSRDVVATGEDWKAATGPILESDFLMGEAYDARKELPGWAAPGYDDAAWDGVVVADDVSVPVEAYPTQPVRVLEELRPRGVAEPTPGAYVFDLGQNFAGFARLKVFAPAGTEIVLRFAERLNPDGTIYTTNLRGARATDRYVCRGGGEEVWQPRFTFHGFQYVEVTGLPGPPADDTITGIALSSDTPVVGSFECSDPVANQLYSNICWTQRMNFIDIPTDCPQRDERLGWTGDAQIYVRTATFNTDVAAFFTKWLVDLVDARLPNGEFPDVAPRRVAMGGGTAAWGDAGVICPWTIHQVYGDTRVLSRHYEAMAGWIEYCRQSAKDLLRPAEGYGDWLSIRANTPKDVLATAYFAYSTSLMARVAEALGKADDAERYRRLFEDIREAFQSAYVTEDGEVQGDTQTVYVLALAFDLLPEAMRPRALERLVADIESREGHLSTGFVGTKDLMNVLTRFGRTDVAYRLFEQTSFPSWRFSISHGATSIWERWDGWTPESGFQDPGMNSFAHYSFGAVGEWMFRTIAGIDTEGVGYERLRIAPRPGGSLEWAEARYRSIHGLVRTSWRRAEGSLELDVTIPTNTTATVVLPTSETSRVTESGRPLERAEGVVGVRGEDGAVVLDVESGEYSFRMPAE